MSRDERALEAGLSDPAVAPALAGGELEILGLLPRSSNYTFLVRATGEDGDQALGVYKPQRGEIPLWDFPEGTLCRREVAAYVVARALGWPNVPPTILRDGPEGLGSVQTFVSFDPEEHYFTLQERFAEDFRAVAAFDLVVNNADRKGGHCLLGEDGRIWLIDHGVCFSAEPKLRTVIWEHMDEPIPASLLAGIERLGVALDEGGTDRDELGALLNEEELLALRRRIGEIAASPVFPGPGGDRPFPWPPV
ncbi:MAG TPA: SCO1664 family protein [Actinomycetota bacterium]|nr:SCO1664 family protein [Actinomycetota bacterium]